LSGTEKAVKEIERWVKKQIYTSEGKFFMVTCTNFLKVDSVKTKYMDMGRDQNAEDNHKKICNKLFERKEGFRYFGTTLTNRNSLRKKLKAD